MLMLCTHSIVRPVKNTFVSKQPTNQRVSTPTFFVTLFSNKALAPQVCNHFCRYIIRHLLCCSQWKWRQVTGLVYGDTSSHVPPWLDIVQVAFVIFLLCPKRKTILLRQKPFSLFQSSKTSLVERQLQFAYDTHK